MGFSRFGIRECRPYKHVTLLQHCWEVAIVTFRQRCCNVDFRRQKCNFAATSQQRCCNVASKVAGKLFGNFVAASQQRCHKVAGKLFCNFVATSKQRCCDVAIRLLESYFVPLWQPPSNVAAQGCWKVIL